MTIFHIAGVDYDRAAVKELREKLIDMRNKALGEHFDPNAAVVLSHTLALLHQMSEHIWGTGE